MLPVPPAPRSAASCDWLRNATFDALMRAAAAAAIDGHGEMQGVEQWLLLRSHWSRSFRSSSAVGPPETCVATKHNSIMGFFYVLLTMHLSIIFVINQLNAQILVFYNKFIIRLYMFRALCAHHQEVKIVLYSIWYHYNLRDSHLQVWWYQMLYNTILTSWRWAHSAQNM